MRVLLALDGSATANAARQAVASLAWPSGSVVHVLGVIDWDLASGTLSGDRASGTRAGDSRAIERVVETASASLQKDDLASDATVVCGRPASVIVERARELRADLVVVGSRGRGPFASLLLGSVSAEVVDHAPCPVLVIRAPLDGPALVAVDGSSSADAAVTYLVANRAFTDRPIEVVSVTRPLGYESAWDVAGLSVAALERWTNGGSSSGASSSASRHARRHDSVQRGIRFDGPWPKGMLRSRSSKQPPGLAVA